jgi:hypothetical protein
MEEGVFMQLILTKGPFMQKEGRWGGEFKSLRVSVQKVISVVKLQKYI